MLSTASASPKFVARIPNGADVPNVPAVGHLDPEGSDRLLNDFGTAFKKAGNKWTEALCHADSDGDGQTNGQELGDPCCVWTTGATPLRVTGLSDPGVKASVADASLWKSLDCATGGSTATITTAPAPAASAATVTSPAPATSTKVSSGSDSSTSTATELSSPSGSSNSTSTTKSSSSPSVAAPSPSSTTAKSNSTTPSSTTKIPTTTPAATSAASEISFSVATFTLISGAVVAKPEYPSRVPNGWNVPSVGAVGHKDLEGRSESLNAFGKAFDGVNKKWTLALCQVDSDSDGQSNGQGSTIRAANGSRHRTTCGSRAACRIQATRLCGPA
uniref:Temptin Cys/Cys disulfide domain-containing protein n=1 Tax=Globisporangium ultimum (strain ATCC 200006 / CBS 805.95 / DAOM BR144) TaxID=431595 RepID=K3X0X2_GLOUD